MNRASSVAFVTTKLKADFEALGEGKSEEKALHEEIYQTIHCLSSDYTSGTKIPKRIWPKFYKKHYFITNLWKRDLPSGWRITYTIKIDEEKIVCLILEWMTHKEYNRRFGHHDS